jgi:dienelactone hydrolase
MRPARDGTRQDIHAFGPRGTGTSPVVVALHGIDGSGQDMAEFATRLARAGMVVFASDLPQRPHHTGRPQPDWP